MQASFSSSPQFAKDVTDVLPPSIPQRQVSREFQCCSCINVPTRSSQATPRTTPSRPITSCNEKQYMPLFPKYASLLHTSDSASVLTATSTNHSAFEHTILGKTSHESLLDDDEKDDGICLRRHFYRIDNREDDETSTDFCDEPVSHRWVHSSGIFDPSSSSEWTMPLQPQRRSSLCGVSEGIL